MKISGRFLIDTNILIYATLPNEPRYNMSRAVLRHAEVSGTAFVSSQNLAEMYPTLTGPRTQPTDTPQAARRKIEAIGRLRALEVLPVTFEVVSSALAICEEMRITRQRYFDMQLVAMMQLYDIPTIVTENIKDFQGIIGIRAVNPFD